MLRAFIAIPLPSDIRSYLADIISKVSSAKCRISWVTPENLHLTLKFLGEIQDDRVLEIAGRIREGLKDFKRFSASLSQISGFPNLQNPKVIIVAIELGKEKIKEIANIVDTALLPLGFAKEKREFKTHITIGRVRNIEGVHELTEKLKNLSITAMAFEVQEVLLMRSELRSSLPPIYSRLTEVILK